LKSDRAKVTGRVVWPVRRSAHDGLPAILCDNVDEKLIDFAEIEEETQMPELISKLSRARARAGCCDPRNAVSCTTDL
jgi:hypothetical protein